MNILFLGYDNKDTRLIKILNNRGHQVTHSREEKFNLDIFDLIISFGYRYIIKDEAINYTKRPIINLHISYLPFNRGAHPNFWSHFDNTPIGVSIHHIDSGIDTGPIIFRKKVLFKNSKLTLYQSYKILKNEIENLFIENIDSIEKYNYETFISAEKGSFHYREDLPDWVNWNLTIEDIINKGKKK